MDLNNKWSLCRTVDIHTALADEEVVRIEAWLSTLQQSGYRLTSSRRAVVEVVAISHHALTAMQIYSLAQVQHADLGRATVYRTLEKLSELGLVQSVHDEDESHRYVAVIDDHQLLVICRECGRSDAIQSERLEQLLDTIVQDQGYRLQNHLVQVFGLCEGCQ
jgi:Fur family transcriptional regulator, ferric uptake regulator